MSFIDGTGPKRAGPSALVVLVGAILAGCAYVPSRAPMRGGDPLEPAAPEAPLPRVEGPPGESTEPPRAPAAEGVRDPHAGHGETSAPERADPHAGHRTPGAPPPAYSCPMHPDVRSDGPGNCPSCGMALERRGDAR